MNPNKRKIIYFITGPVATAAQMAAANALSDIKTIVCFRNAEQVTSDESLEKCDGVAGDVPARYLTAKKDETLPPRVDGGLPELPGFTAAHAPVAPSAPVTPTPEPAAPVASADTPAPVVPAAPAVPVAPASPSVAELSDNVTNAQLKEALTTRGIAFARNANKATLLALYRGQ